MRHLVPILVMASALVLSAAAVAQGRCGPRQSIIEVAWQQYQERPVAMALASGGAVLEVLATRDGATFTMLHSTPNGMSCVVATGESWQASGWQPPDREGLGS